MLHKMQSDFKDFILNGRIADSIAGNIVEGDLKLEDRLSIYKNNVQGNLVGSLKITYPNFMELVGEEFFEFIAKKYALANPPNSGALVEYGESFSQFLGDIPQLDGFKYAADFVKFEWLNHVCHHAQEEKSLTLQDLAIRAGQDENYLPNLKKNIYLFESKHPILQIWQMCIDKKTKKLNNQKCYTLIIKDEGSSEVHELTQKEFKFLHDLQNDGDFKGFTPAEVANGIKKFINLGAFNYEM